MRVVSELIVVVLVAAACSPETIAVPATKESPTSTSHEVTTTTTVPTTTTTRRSGAIGLYRVDAATLVPIPESEPFTTGDWISGELSPNREWLALHLEIGSDPATNLVQVIETSTGEIVAESPGVFNDLVAVSDDGTVYTARWSQRRQLGKLVLGADRFESVSHDFPGDVHRWGLPVLVDLQRVAWIGTHGPEEPATATVVIVDLVSGEATTHVLPDVTLGAVAETDVGDWSLSELVEPAVVWDAPRNRALIVHGDEDKVTIMDLDSGETATHDWTASMSWVDRIFAWLIPPARAKGPDAYGVTRSAVLDPSGERLYVGSSISEVVITADGDWFIESTPQGVEATSTETWELIDRWDIPASEVMVSPDGKRLVATGRTWTDSLSTSEVHSKDLFVIDADSHELLGRFDVPDFWPDVQFSPDGQYMYVGAHYVGSLIEIVDLATVEVTGIHRASGEYSLWGEALLATTWR